jgi:thiol-disulfide isomerase/thioredoxin
MASRKIVYCGLFSALLAAALIGCGRSSPPVVTSSSNTTQPVRSSAASPDVAEQTPAALDADEAITLQTVDIDGYREALARHTGKVIFVDFWATWCPPCMENFPHTVHIRRAFPEDQVAVISVSFDEPEDQDKALKFLRQQEARFENFLTVYGAGTEGTEAFEIDGGVPHYKIYDRQGNIAASLSPGPDLKITLELLDNEIRQVLQE